MNSPLSFFSASTATWSPRTSWSRRKTMSNFATSALHVSSVSSCTFPAKHGRCTTAAKHERTDSCYFRPRCALSCLERHGDASPRLVIPFIFTFRSAKPISCTGIVPSLCHSRFSVGQDYHWLITLQGVRSGSLFCWLSYLHTKLRRDFETASGRFPKLDPWSRSWAFVVLWC